MPAFTVANSQYVSK